MGDHLSISNGPVTGRCPGRAEAPQIIFDHSGRVGCTRVVRGRGSWNKMIGE